MNSLDKFYTSQEEVNKCLVFWEQHVKVKEHHTIIEPSAGNGAFSNKINNIISFDIQPDPKTDNIIKADFLKSVILLIKSKTNLDALPNGGLPIK